ncbi:MAG TPA: SDR family NAD(P)-dependent oxidoreductase [Candidatus Binatia bacterium]|nr:SDR family NAD(P)-dependent oxidoreductase [Candidatus Binatia bacterium]
MKDCYGPWALVTGASSGIGREFARRLAGAGLSVAVAARRREVLEELAGELRSQPGVECRVVAMDLAEPGAAARLADAVADLEVGLLVANAGTGWIGRFDLQEPDFHSRLIRLHCELTVELAARLIPSMRKRRRGGVVIVSSAGAFLPLPYYAVYGGTKALLQNWGEAIAAELKGTGVDVLVVSPGDTKTGFQEVAGEMSSKWSTVEDVVAEALAGLGKKTVVVPGLENRIGLLAAKVLPRAMVVSMVEKRQRAQTPRDRR